MVRGRGSITWTAENDAKLLVAIITTQEPKWNYDLLCQKLTELTGCDVNPKMIQNRLGAIKRQVKDDLPSSSGPSTPKKASPEKRKKSTTQESSSEANDDEEANSNEENQTSPPKNKKKATKKEESMDEHST